MLPSCWENSRTVSPRARSAATRRRPTKPLAPVTRISLAMTQQARAHLFKFVDGLHVIVGAADVQPVSAESLHVHGPAGLQKLGHEIVEAVLAAGGNHLEHRAI